MKFVQGFCILQLTYTLMLVSVSDCLPTNYTPIVLCPRDTSQAVINYIILYNTQNFPSMCLFVCQEHDTLPGF